MKAIYNDVVRLAGYPGGLSLEKTSKKSFFGQSKEQKARNKKKKQNSFYNKK